MGKLVMSHEIRNECCLPVEAEIAAGGWNENSFGHVHIRVFCHGRLS